MKTTLQVAHTACSAAAVEWGLERRSLDGIEAIGVDEVQWRKGHRYLTLVYQIGASCRRLLYIGEDRSEEEVTDAALRLRLDGYALLGREYDPTLDAEGEAALESGFGYEPRLIGTLILDRLAGTWSRIEIVALGDVYGTPGSPGDLIYRPGRQPLGVFFELVKDEGPADRVPPRSYRSCNKLNARYSPPVRKVKPNW